MARKRTHFNEELFGPYLYHGSTTKIPVGESIVPQPGHEDQVHATEDITYASDFGKHVHKVVPHDWSEIEPWDHDDPDNPSEDLIKSNGELMQSFDSKKGFKVIGHTKPLKWREGVVHPERKM
jgi:hypothetical protein